MSARRGDDAPETLFSLELLVESVRLDKRWELPSELAVGLRLLDFPTLLIHQQGGGVKARDGERVFNRGKCCFFKMKLRSLHAHLSSTPLYAMVLAVTEEPPRLVGSSLVPLAKAADGIRRDASERGVCGPSSHWERGQVSISSLTGEKIGSISLSYKLLCLGESLLPHITETRGLRRTSVSGEGQEVQNHVQEEDRPTWAVDCEGARPPVGDLTDAEGAKDCSNQDERGREGAAAEGVDPEETSRSPTEEEANVFCPPRLYYSNTPEEKNRILQEYKSEERDMEAFALEDWRSEEEADSSKAPSFPAMPPKVRTETSGLTPDVLGEALRRMPILNALLVELSQLNIRNADRSPTADRSPVCAHGTSPRRGDTPRKSGRQSRQDSSLHLKQSHSLGKCSTPAAHLRTKNKPEGGLMESPSCRKSATNKLVYGTTRTFNLRLKQVSPLAPKPRECTKLLQNEARPSPAKGRTKSKRALKSGKRKAFADPGCSLNENVETLVQSVGADSPLGGTVTLREGGQRGQKGGGKVLGAAPRTSDAPSLSEKDRNCIRIPRADVGDVGDVERRRSESDRSRPELDSGGEKTGSAGSSRRGSAGCGFSDGSEEADYADDFNSLAPSDAFSPDPASSPEPSRAKTPKTPTPSDVCDSDLGSGSARDRAARLPVPVKAPRSPQRSLRGTHAIRPRVHASALSFSSSDGDRGAVSLDTSGPRTRLTPRSPGAESVTAPRGQRGESAESGGPVRGPSAESISSFEAVDAGELDDELGTLDFRKEYQHISQLVACKLPGYTM